MAFLSLARGDSEARDLLSRALKARYGPRPVLLDSLRLHTKANSRGPLGLPAVLDGQVTWAGLNAWRSVVRYRVFGITFATSIESFDTETVYRKRRGPVQTFTDPVIVTSFRRRLWATVAMWIIPLTREGVTLKSVDETSFQAIHDKYPGDVATIRLNPDDSIASIEVERFRPELNRSARYMMKMEVNANTGLQILGGLPLPHGIIYEWEGAAPRAVKIVGAEPNIVVAPEEFKLS